MNSLIPTIYIYNIYFNYSIYEDQKVKKKS